MNNRTLGVIGLGSMGLGAARSALKRGVRTWGYDPRPEACEAFAADGGLAAASAAVPPARETTTSMRRVDAGSRRQEHGGP